MYCWRFFMRNKCKYECKLRFYYLCLQLNDFSRAHTHTQIGYYVNAFALHATRERKDNETKERESARQSAKWGKRHLQFIELAKLRAQQQRAAASTFNSDHVTAT